MREKKFEIISDHLQYVTVWDNLLSVLFEAAANAILGGVRGRPSPVEGYSRPPLLLPYFFPSGFQTVGSAMTIGVEDAFFRNLPSLLFDLLHPLAVVTAKFTGVRLRAGIGIRCVIRSRIND